MRRMPPTPTGRMPASLTVLGCSTAAPHPGSPAAGYLVEWGVDGDPARCRPGRRPAAPDASWIRTDLTAVVIGHMHADHYLDLAGLRYLFPWGEDARAGCPSTCPRRTTAAGRTWPTRSPSGRASSMPPMTSSSTTPDAELRIGPLSDPVPPRPALRPRLGRRRSRRRTVPASRTRATPGPAGRWPTFAHGADLLLVEATLRRRRHDDPRRGHLTPEEAIELAHRGRGRARALLVHYPPDRGASEIAAMCAADRPVRSGRRLAGLTSTDRLRSGRPAAPDAGQVMVSTG